jgi:hypothetical protein
MLSRIDDFIFPNRCEVIEIIPSQRYIYPIFKNGSSSLYKYAMLQQCKILINQQINKVDTIDVIIRNPVERFVSGINTFVYNTKISNPTLDIDTIIYFAETYLFLNRHYCPQLSWLINLSKYTKKEAKLCINGMEMVSKYTVLHIKPPEENLLTTTVIERLTNNVHNEMYIRLDNLLLDLIGKELTFTEILEYIKTHDVFAYTKLKCIALD